SRGDRRSPSALASADALTKAASARCAPGDGGGRGDPALPLVHVDDDLHGSGFARALGTSAGTSSGCGRRCLHIRRSVVRGARVTEAAHLRAGDREEAAEADQPAELARREVVGRGDGAGEDAEEAVDLLLPAGERPEEDLLLRPRRCEGGELESEAVDRQRRSVALMPVAGERLFERLRSPEPRDDGIGEQLGVAQGVVDAERGDRVDREACVADEGPAGSVGNAEEVGQVGAAVDPFGPAAGADARAEVAGEVERREQVALDVAPEGPELVRGPADV